MARKRATTPEQAIEDQLRDFETSPGIPKNLGNFPDELDPDPRLATAPERTPEPAPEPEPVPHEPDTDTEPRETAPAPEPEDDESPSDRRLRELEERLQARDRELEFLRAGYQGGQQAAQQQAPPVARDVIALIDQQLGGYQVTPEDVQTILNDPLKGAEYLQNGIRAAVAAAVSMSLNQARAEFAQYQSQQQGAQQLRSYFYGRNPELEPYADVVGTYAQQVRAQYPQITNEQLCDETARRVKGRLKDMGVRLERQTGTPTAPRQTRARGTFGEMGGGSRGGGGGRALSPIEKQLRDFEAGTSAYLGR